MLPDLPLSEYHWIDVAAVRRNVTLTGNENVFSLIRPDAFAIDDLFKRSMVAMVIESIKQKLIL
jgi:hypothetical protein